MVMIISDVCNCKDIGTKHLSSFNSREVWITSKAKCNNKTPNLRKDQNLTMIASTCDAGLRGNNFV